MTFGIHSFLEGFSFTFSSLSDGHKTDGFVWKLKKKRKQILGNWRNTKQQNPSAEGAATF